MHAADNAYVAIVFSPLQSVISDRADLNTMRGTLKEQRSKQMFAGAAGDRIRTIEEETHRSNSSLGGGV